MFNSTISFWPHFLSDDEGNLSNDVPSCQHLIPNLKTQVYLILDAVVGNISEVTCLAIS